MNLGIYVSAEIKFDIPQELKCKQQCSQDKFEGVAQNKTQYFPWTEPYPGIQFCLARLAEPLRM